MSKATDTVNIKVLLKPGSMTATFSVPKNATMSDVRKKTAEQPGVAKRGVLTLDGKAVNDVATVAELGLNVDSKLVYTAE